MTAQVFMKPTLIKGQPAEIRCVELGGQVFSISGGPVRVLGLEDDWFEDLDDPHAVLERVRSEPSVKADLFTFWQRPPDYAPRYEWDFEMVDLAVLPVSSYEHWFTKQIKSRVRNQIRKAHKAGIEVREVPYDDEFVRGMTAIFNESPVRQGRPFWHYGKDIETVKTQFSRYVQREVMLAAYFEGRIIGLVMLGDAGRFALTGQIISSLEHRDKAINNALIAKCVEVCEERGWEYLVYLFWSDDSLAEFKRRSGFDRVSVPRYYIPLTAKGRLAMRFGLHKGWRAAIPSDLKARAKAWRTQWYQRGS